MSEVQLVVDAGAELAEGPVWHGGYLWWIDVLAGVVHRYDPAGGTDEAFEIGQEVGALAPRLGGGFLLAVRDGFGTWDGPGSSLTIVAPVERDESGNRMNDGKCDRNGRFWASTMAFDAAPARGALYRLDADLTVTTHLERLSIGNGLAWSADDARLYFIDSQTGGVDVLDFDSASGTLRQRRQLVGVSSGSETAAPDGMTIDADDCLWVAVFGGGQVRRYTPDGVLERVVHVPVSNVTSCAFGGDDLGDLYITTASHGLDDQARAAQPHAGGVFVTRPGVTGTPTLAFRG